MLHRMVPRLKEIYKKNLIEIWAFAVVLVIGGMLRLAYIPDSIVWNGDTARDFLVARHLATYHEPLEVGHSAYGLRISSDKAGNDPYGMSHYPTLYYRALAMVWQVMGSILNVSIAVVLYQLLGIVTLYVGLRKSFGRAAAWCATTLISLSSVAIGNSLSVSLYLILPLFFGVLGLVLLGIHSKKTWLFLSAALLCVLGSIIHYSLLFCFPWVVLAGILTLRGDERIKDSIIFGTGSVFLGISVFGLLHVEVIRFYGLQPFLATFTDQYRSTAPSLDQMRLQVGNLLLLRLQGLFFSWKTGLAAITVGLITLTFSSKKEFRPSLGFLLGFAVSLLLLVAVKSENTFHVEQVMLFDYVALILLGVSSGSIFHSVQKEGKILIAIIFGLVIYAATNFGYRQPLHTYSFPISTSRAHAQELIDKSPYPLEDTEFYVSSYYSWDYETPTVVFWLEELSGKKLIKLTEAYNNLSWEGSAKHHMIVSCQRFPASPAMESASCQHFIRHFTDSPQYVLEKELFSNDHYRSFLYKKK